MTKKKNKGSRILCFFWCKVVLLFSFDYKKQLAIDFSCFCFVAFTLKNKGFVFYNNGFVFNEGKIERKVLATHSLIHSFLTCYIIEKNTHGPYYFDSSSIYAKYVGKNVSRVSKNTLLALFKSSNCDYRSLRRHLMGTICQVNL